MLNEELFRCDTAIDGWVAKTRKPFIQKWMTSDKDGCWSLVVLTGCDAKCRFTMFSCLDWTMLDWTSANYFPLRLFEAWG
jgi:hypothetical protein